MLEFYLRIIIQMIVIIIEAFRFAVVWIFMEQKHHPNSDCYYHKNRIVWDVVVRARKKRFGGGYRRDSQIGGERKSVVGRPTIVCGQDCRCLRRRHRRLRWRRGGGVAGSRAAEGAKRLGSLRRYQCSVVSVELSALHAPRRCAPSSFSSSIVVEVDTAPF